MSPADDPPPEAARPQRAFAAVAAARHAERHGWSRLIFEMALLVISVLLAFAVNDWSNSRERERLQHRVLEDLRREITVNAGYIDSSIGYHETMARTLRKARDQVAAGGAWDYPPEFEGLREILFQRAAYDAALLSQTLPQLSVNTLGAVSALYTQQDQYAQSLRIYAGATIQSDNKDPVRDLRLAENCLKQMAHDEHQLQPLMKAALDAVNEELKSG